MFAVIRTRYFDRFDEVKGIWEQSPRLELIGRQFATEDAAEGFIEAIENEPDEDGNQFYWLAPGESGLPSFEVVPVVGA